MKYLTTFILISIVCFAFDKSEQSIISVSLINLISTPEKYHNKYIRVIGVIDLEFENNKIWLSKESRKYKLNKNALWIVPNYTQLAIPKDELKKYNGKYVLIEGIFNKNSKGHLGMNSGEINHITRYNLWE